MCSYGLAFGEPTAITDRAGLENIKNNMSGEYILSSDIDLSGANWTPLGTTGSGGSGFSGTLDGNGHVILNMTIDLVQDGAAFFTKIQGDAVIKNLGFENASVTNKTQSRTAILAGFMNGNARIENCYIANSTILARWCVGSFVGRAMSMTDNGNAAIRNCYSSAYISVDGSGGVGMTGGIIGNIFDGNKIVVENCYFSGIIQRVLGDNAEGNIAGIVGWIGLDGTQTLSGYTLQKNVNLAPYLLNNYGKHRISSTRSDEVTVNDPTPGPNYSLASTVVSTYNDWGNTSAIISDQGAQYGDAKKDGANIPNGDDKAKTQDFYTGMGWDVGNSSNIWTMSNGGYPVFPWEKDTTHFVVAPVSPVSVTYGSEVDLSKYIFSGRGLELTFTTAATDKIELSGSVVSITSPITAPDEVVVSVQEGSLEPKYSLKISLMPGVVPIATPQDLELVRTYPTAKFSLAADLDMSNIDFVPLPDFSGEFDGDGHVIFNLKPTAQDGTAFFYKISGNAVVKNLGFENASVDGGWNVRVAVLTGYMAGNAQIENCYIANSTVRGRWHVGSFVGRMDGGNTAIRNCYSSAYLSTPTGTQATDGENTGHVAGIVGVLNASGCKVENCYFSGIIQRNPSVQQPNEGQTAGIVAWNTNANNVITKNVNLAPYLLSNTGKYRISSVQGNPAPGNTDPSGPNYSISTTVVSGVNDWENASAVVATDDNQYGEAKRHGLNIPNGDANAKAEEFYKTTLGWDFNDTWAISSSYPYLKWAEQTRPHFVVAPTTPSLAAATPLDLSKYIFSGRGLELAFSKDSPKITLSDGVVGYAQSVAAPDTVTVSVTEGDKTLLPYSLRVALAPAYSLAIGTFSNGSVSAERTFYGEDETVTLTIAPAEEYRLATISAYKTGDTETPVALAGEGGNELTFTMPDYDVTVVATFAEIEYEVTIGDFAGGEVTADKDASVKGGTVTLTITPDDGYELNEISAHKTGEDNTAVTLNGTDSERTFTMPDYGVTVVATFTAIDYNLTIGTFTGGSVTAGQNPYNVGNNVTLTITPDEGYELVEISAYKTGEEGTIVTLEGEDSERIFTMPAYDVTVSATFKLADYTVAIGDFTGGKVEADEVSYNLGGKVTLTVIPDEGYAFGSISAHKTGDETTPVTLTEDNSTWTFNMLAYDVTVVATFTAIDYTVTAGAFTNGSVTPDKNSYNVNETVTLTIEPEEGYELDEISAYKTGENQVSVALTKEGDEWTFAMPAHDVTVEATFKLADYSVTIGTFIGGNVTADEASYNFNDKVTLTIAIDTDYELADISAHKTGDETTPVALTGDDSERTFDMPAYDVTVKALFTTTAEYSVAIGTFANGSVGAAKNTYKGNEEVALTITPDAGYELDTIFAYKTGDTDTPVTLTETSSGWTFNMPAYGVTVVATFTAIEYTVAIGDFIGGKVEADAASYVKDEAVTLTITPDDGYELATISAHKTGDEETPVTLDGEGSGRTFTMPAYGVTVVATFTEIVVNNKYSVAIGTFTGGEVVADKASYEENEAVTLTIITNNGYEFDSISVYKTDDEETLVILAGEGSERTFNMPAYGVTVVATFTEIVVNNKYSVAIATFTGGSVAADKASYEENEAVTLTITPAAGYALATISVHKTDDEAATVALTGTGSNRTFNMPAYGVTVTATFTLLQTDVHATTASPVVVIGRKGELEARFEGTAAVKLYSLTGALLNEATASGGYTYSVRQGGIYILSVAGKSYRVLVK
jgi:hypothetical protein